MVPAVQLSAPAVPVSHGAAPQDDLGRYVKVESPIVGTFYRKPSPDADMFVKEGDTVSKGDTLCIIEAMKLMNEIEAPTSGKIVKILGVEGQVIEFGEVLFLIDPAV
jgi:acetyl-CoA carboxylase biotin carboxyl carrier protein